METNGFLRGVYRVSLCILMALAYLVLIRNLTKTRASNIINDLFILNKFCPDSILVCPSVDRQSTPPGSVWPECPPLEEIYRTASEVFSNSYLGGGMVSFFPELNRKRPPLDHIRFVSHGLCPILHAADDVSVMRTLDTIPYIIQTARSFIKDRAV